MEKNFWTRTYSTSEYIVQTKKGVPRETPFHFYKLITPAQT